MERMRGSYIGVKQEAYDFSFCCSIWLLPWAGIVFLWCIALGQELTIFSIPPQDVLTHCHRVEIVYFFSCLFIFLNHNLVKSLDYLFVVSLMNFLSPIRWKT